MKYLFDKVSFLCSRKVTQSYSTSFSMAVRLLSPSIQPAIYSIYGFVRFTDEIVDSFHEFDKCNLIAKFEEDLYHAINHKISLNPILNSFQNTVHTYSIDTGLIDAFLASMKMDLEKELYNSEEEYKQYIYGSADVVGLMCLKVFVKGDAMKYQELKEPAMRLGSAFQKVNFLRDLRSDAEFLQRSYFPNVNFLNLDQKSKMEIIREIEEDFQLAYPGILQLPREARLGVYTAYTYYKRLLKKLKNLTCKEITTQRIRMSNHIKFGLLARSYIHTKLNLI